MKNTGNPTHFPIRDDKGDQFLCPIDAVTDQNALTEQEFDECVEEDVVRRYSGNVIVQSARGDQDGEYADDYSI